MIMKKAFLTGILLILLCFSLFAVGNDQKIYSVDSEVYDDITLVYMASGHALPSTAGPWSGSELRMMIEAIDPSEIPEYASKAYNRVLEELNVQPTINYKNGGMEFDGTLNLELYGHTFKDGDKFNRTDRNGVKETAFAGRQWWFGKNLNDITPFFAVDWEVYHDKFFYSFFELGLQNAYHGGEYEIGSTALNSNIFAFQNFKLNAKLLDVSIPQKAFASVGGNTWNIEVGRDKVNWGAGETGNLLISDNFPYYDFIKATAYSEKYKYTYLLSFFPNKTNYYSGTGENLTDSGSVGRSTARMNGIYLYSAHRFEGRFFKDKLSFALTEAITYEDSEGQIQFTALSPMYFMHNAFISSNSNSTVSLELNWATPLRGLNVYGQLLVDQGAFPGLEKKRGPGMESAESPDAIALLGGAKYVTGLGKGVLKANAEAAYVGPYTYLRDSGEGEWGLDYIAAVRARMYAYEDYIPSGDTSYDEFVIGYKYGPDCLTGQLKLDYEIGRFNYTLKGLAMIHGTHDIYTKWRKIPANCSEEDFKAEFTGISTVHGDRNFKYNDESKRNSRWCTFDIGLGVSYDVSEKINVFGNVDAVMMKNIYNYSSEDKVVDVQAIIGGSIKLF